MKFQVLIAAVFGAVFASAALGPADCDCFDVCDSDNQGPTNCYNSNIGCGTLEEPTCCEICGCNCAVRSHPFE
ncbi:hypothetical protein ESCO_001902 [Escovopsis weberi]|uniref:Uncharacterized protein n=1 Tax=Escovopsis weberi TaxID=150374 RepID=A0A0M9VWI7_ESCWE|nr:hypothetical protein ESCO_001902 [Escovopsis weberi]